MKKSFLNFLFLVASYSFFLECSFAQSSNAQSSNAQSSEIAQNNRLRYHLFVDIINPQKAMRVLQYLELPKEGTDAYNRNPKGLVLRAEYKNTDFGRLMERVQVELILNQKGAVELRYSDAVPVYDRQTLINDLLQIRVILGDTSSFDGSSQSPETHYSQTLGLIEWENLKRGFSWGFGVSKSLKDGSPSEERRSLYKHGNDFRDLKSLILIESFAVLSGYPKAFDYLLKDFKPTDVDSGIFKCLFAGCTPDQAIQDLEALRTLGQKEWTSYLEKRYREILKHNSVRIKARFKALVESENSEHHLELASFAFSHPYLHEFFKDELEGLKSQLRQLIETQKKDHLLRLSRAVFSRRHAFKQLKEEIHLFIEKTEEAQPLMDLALYAVLSGLKLSEVEGLESETILKWRIMSSGSWKASQDDV